MNTAPKTIFVCDDDSDVLGVLTVLLQDAGYHVLTAHEHKELKSLMQKMVPDLLILDVHLPEKDGFWVAENLQNLGVAIPIIFLTGDTRWAYRVYAPFVGSVEYLIKPFDPQVLLNKIKQVLAKTNKHKSTSQRNLDYAGQLNQANSPNLT